MTLRFPTPAEFGRQFTEHALRTVRLVRVFDDADLGLRPGEGSLTTAGQIGHLCGNHNFLRGVLEETEPTVDLFHRSYDVSSVAAAVQSLGTAIREVQDAALRITDSLWDEEITVFGPEWRMTRGQMAYMLMDHETHHRGQLTVYARLAGKTPPLLYAPVDESVLIT